MLLAPFLFIYISLYIFSGPLVLAGRPPPCCFLWLPAGASTRPNCWSFSLFLWLLSWWMCFRLHVFSLSFPSLSLFSLSLGIPLPLFAPLPLVYHPFPVHTLAVPSLPYSPSPHRQTYPITRTITVKARQWIKRMISPQWPTPWQGWVPPRLCPSSPAAPAPSPACTTASCSAPAARRPLKGWRWTQIPTHWHRPYSKCKLQSSFFLRWNLLDQGSPTFLNLRAASWVLSHTNGHQFATLFYYTLLFYYSFIYTLLSVYL